MLQGNPSRQATILVVTQELTQVKLTSCPRNSWWFLSSTWEQLVLYNVFCLGYSCKHKTSLCLPNPCLSKKNCIGSSVENLLTMYIHVSIQYFYSVYLFVYPYANTTYLKYCRFLGSLEIRGYQFPNQSFCDIIFDIPDHLYFDINFKINILTSTFINFHFCRYLCFVQSAIMIYFNSQVIEK